jgi:hypothetical protein
MRVARHGVQGFPCHAFVKFGGPDDETAPPFLDGLDGRLRRSTT